MISRKLSHKLDELKKMIQDAVVSRVVEDFVDINTPLKQFTDAVHVPKGLHLQLSMSFLIYRKFYFYLKELLVERQTLLIEQLDYLNGQNVQAELDD